MPTQTFNVYGPEGLSSPSGLVYQLGADTLLQTLSLTESTNNKGHYSATGIFGLSGNLEINLVSGGVVYTKAMYYVESAMTTASYYPQTSVGAIDFAAMETAVLALSGSGAYVVTISVTDGVDPLENVTVRMNDGAADNYVATTNASGVATFALDAATYTLSMVKSGYSHTPESVVISGAGNTAATMSAIVLTPSSVGLTTGYLYTYDETGTIETGVVIDCSASVVRSGGTGIAFDSKVRQVTSDGTGLVEFTNLVKGATYLFRRGDNSTYSITIPTTASTTYELPDIIGQE